MPWTAVASAQQGTGNNASVRTLSANPDAGLLLALAVSTYGSATLTISDTAGNAWTQAGGYSISGAIHTSLWIAQANAAGVETISITPSAAVYMGICLALFSYSSPATFAVDGTSFSTGNSGPFTSNPIPVSGADELALAAFGQGSGQTTWTPGAGWTNAATQPNGATNEACALDYAIDVSSSLEDAGAFTVNGDWSAVGASIVATPTGGGGGSSLLLKRRRGAA